MLIKYGTKFCGDCRRLGAILDKLNIEYLDINVDENIAKELDITTIPVLIKYENNKEVDRLIGLKSINLIKEFVK